VIGWGSILNKTCKELKRGDISYSTSLSFVFSVNFRFARLSRDFGDGDDGLAGSVEA
jgi:hypothetical protein